MISEDDPLVLMVEALAQTQAASVAAAEAATDAATAAGNAEKTATEGKAKIADLEVATKKLIGTVTGWRQQVLDVTEARRKGRRWAIAGLAGGLVLYPLLAATVPYGGYLAALAVNGTVDRLDAGQALMKAANPVFSDQMARDWYLIDGTTANAKAIAACQDLTAEVGAVSCKITVPPP